MRSTIARVLLILCVTATGCTLGSQQQNTDEAITHVKQGRDLYREGDLDGAIAEYRTALRLDPNNVKAHYNLGNALWTKGDENGAIAEYRTALRLDPAHINAHNNLGTALHARGKPTDTTEQSTEVLRLLPDTPADQNDLGFVRQQFRELR